MLTGNLPLLSRFGAGYTSGMPALVSLQAQPATLDIAELDAKEQHLFSLLRDLRRVIVAYSGVPTPPILPGRRTGFWAKQPSPSRRIPRRFPNPINAMPKPLRRSAASSTSTSTHTSLRTPTTSRTTKTDASIARTNCLYSWKRSRRSTATTTSFTASIVTIWETTVPASAPPSYIR